MKLPFFLIPWFTSCSVGHEAVAFNSTSTDLPFYLDNSNGDLPASASQAAAALQPAHPSLSSNLDMELDTFLSTLQNDDVAAVSAASKLPPMAGPCNLTACRLPHCYCDATNIPDGLPLNNTPQFILVAFDGAINMHNYDLYQQIFHQDRKNPNGCPIRATFFLSHRWTDYSHVQNLYAMGHEIALRGVALTGDEANATYENFAEDIVALQQIAKNFADVRPEDVVGMRAPYLKTEGDDQFLAAYDSKLLYDTSILNPSVKPLWPFTLDYALPFTCPPWAPRCPLLSYPGLWEIPVTRLIGPAGVPYGFYTAYEFSKNPIEIAQVLMKFLQGHYTSNRAPLTLNGLSYWLATAEYRLGFELFLEQALQLPDVWFVTSSQLIHWMQRPAGLDSINDFEALQCPAEHRRPDVDLCQTPRSCKTYLEGEEIYFATCRRCPFTFPWTGNYNGCFNDPCPTPVVEYIDTADSNTLHALFLLFSLLITIAHY
ncbi:hypothetical protein RvY_17087 [Ramazzottius varieornatus]|uniref:NodB homology domain-containing protein n=1 Tax=Ramazzottius varieornatus TaxID=947166 RepID=A0A1D1W825_RAMVA|nr:hypothetical protein RvY_17087 [Ramazzottius varieornatus]